METALEWKLADFGLLFASVWRHDLRKIWQPCDNNVNNHYSTLHYGVWMASRVESPVLSSISISHPCLHRPACLVSDVIPDNSCTV